MIPKSSDKVSKPTPNGVGFLMWKKGCCYVIIRKTVLLTEEVYAAGSFFAAHGKAAR
jgi:hypothetical protein